MPDLRAIPLVFWIVAAGCLGAIVGSFINMAAYRLPRNISTVTRTRSFCPQCSAQLSWYENIPILSYLVLLGRCRHCKKPIPIRYLLTEILVTALFCLSAYQFFGINSALVYPYGPEWWRLTAVFAMQLFLIFDLVLLSVVDLELWLIPWECTLLWIPVGFMTAAVFPELHAHATAWTQNQYVDALLDSFSGLVLGAGALWSIGFLTTLFTFVYFRLRKRSDRPKEGMGGGDVHLMAMIGAMLGWKPVVATIFLAVFIGSISGVAKIFWEKLKKWHLGDRYKPWQPTYEISADEAPYVPKFWPLLLFGLIVVLAAGWMIEHSQQTFGLNHAQMFSTQEELRFAKKAMSSQHNLDVRLIPAILMMIVGVLLILSFPFYLLLKKRDQLPQGSIVEKETGEKEEILEGNYIPFGPSLAFAALIVVFYDPLLRSTAWWFMNGSNGPIEIPVSAFHVFGEEQVKALLTSVGELFKWLTQFAGGTPH